ncbi:MAG: gliding motility protein GldM [Bacteroidales bacterium]|jgi:gliding motility-associated protein GldM|nr:gliding motility protein GldM [Bacteroidales bacterium]
MGHGKETPRQKMIGMMYLVLTAMLALNVSAEVLDAFTAVDEGLKKTTHNYVEKNKELYKEFEEQYAINQTKVEPWKQKADEVKKRSDELYDYIQNLKLEIVKTNQGEDTEAITEEGTIINDLLKGKDKYDTPSMILIGSNNNGKAYEFKDMIEEYKDFLVGLCDPKDLRIIQSLESNLDTSDPPPNKEGESKSWEVKHFGQMPLAAVMPLLTKFQVDIRNSETEMVRYLLNQIVAGEITFNKLEATVIPNTSYVLQGNDYMADVFLAAVDTTQPPIVLIGDYDSTRLEDGTWQYNMVGAYDTLEVVQGKGKYQVKGQSIGSHEWGGLIKLMDPSGNYIVKSFQKSYSVAKPNLVVSPTKMNVFYVGVDNPVSVSIAGVPGNKIVPSITNGRIRKRSDGEYIVNPTRPGNSLVTVQAEIDGAMKNMGTAQFRVKPLPDPVVMVAGKKGGKIEKNVLAAQAGVFAEMENFDFDLEFKIIEFTVSTTDRGGYFIGEKAEGSTFTQAQYNLINNLRRNSRVNIEDVKAVGPDGTVRNLPPIVFEII